MMTSTLGAQQSATRPTAAARSQSPVVKGIPGRSAARSAGSGARAGASIGAVYGALSWPDQSWGILVLIGCGLIVGTIVKALSCLAMPASGASRRNSRGTTFSLKPIR